MTLNSTKPPKITVNGVDQVTKSNKMTGLAKMDKSKSLPMMNVMASLRRPDKMATLTKSLLLETRLQRQTKEEVEAIVQHFMKQLWQPPSPKRLNITSGKSFPFVVEIGSIVEIPQLLLLLDNAGQTQSEGATGGALAGVRGSMTSLKSKDAKVMALMIVKMFL